MNRLSMVGIFALLAAMAGGGYWYWQKSEADAAKAGMVTADGKGGGKGGKGEDRDERAEGGDALKGCHGGELISSPARLVPDFASGPWTAMGAVESIDLRRRNAE